MRDVSLRHNLSCNGCRYPLRFDGAVQVGDFFVLCTFGMDQRLRVRYEEVLHLQVHAGVGNYCALKTSEAIKV